MSRQQETTKACCPNLECGSFQIRRRSKDGIWACYVCHQEFATPNMRDYKRRPGEPKPVQMKKEKPKVNLAPYVTIGRGFRWGASFL